MLKKYPKISIITPSFNKGKYLETAIKSVLTQNYPNLEYIIIDGNSNDESIDIIKKYESNISYWITEPDNGQSEALNKGIKLSTGEIIAELDADDFYLPNTLKIVGEYFLKNRNIEFLYGDLAIYNDKGEFLFTKKTTPYNFKELLFSGSLIPQPSSFWRKTVFSKVGYFNENLEYNMDTEFFIRCGLANISFMQIDETLAGFRISKGSKTSSGGAIRNNNIKLIREFSQVIYKRNFSIETIKFLNKLYRLKIFIKRAILRKDYMPFKGKIIAKI